MSHRFTTSRKAPAFHCDYILKETESGYRVMKDVYHYRPNMYFTPGECDALINSEHYVCIIKKDGKRIYNFDINETRRSNERLQE